MSFFRKKFTSVGVVESASEDSPPQIRPRRPKGAEAEGRKFQIKKESSV